jgi:hypothetical protein
MKADKIAAEILRSYMLEHDISTKRLAELTESVTRSVERWKSYGIPARSWELLQLRINSENKEGIWTQP